MRLLLLLPPRPLLPLPLLQLISATLLLPAILPAKLLVLTLRYSSAALLARASGQSKCRMWLPSQRSVAGTQFESFALPAAVGELDSSCIAAAAPPATAGTSQIDDVRCANSNGKAAIAVLSSVIVSVREASG
jgi:hypothetical protein